MQEEDRLEALAGLHPDGKESIVFVHRDNGYPYGPPTGRGLANGVPKVTELINR